MEKGPFYRSGTFWIFMGIILGVVAGGFLPGDRHPVANELFHFLSKAFITLIQGLIIPLLLSTIIVALAQAGDIKAVGRMGGKALLYFELVTTGALFIGLGIGNWLKPGARLPLDPAAVSGLAAGLGHSGWDMVLGMLPSNLILHAAEGEILPVVVFASLFGLALTRTGERGKPVLSFCEGVAQTMFKYTALVMRLTPLGVFGAMAHTVSTMAGGGAASGLRGWSAVFHLLKQYSVLVGSLYLALALMFLLLFVPVMWVCGIRIRGFIRAVHGPALTAYSTASSEAALPGLLEGMVGFGVPRRVASFVIPTGYSFNLDGSTLYLVLASLTIAQAAGIAMPIGQQLLMVLTFMLTSKGVAGVPRATLVIIAGTCASFGLPGEAGVALLLAVDAVMDMARAAVNVIGNGLASVVVAKWEGVYETEPGPSAVPAAGEEGANR